MSPSRWDLIQVMFRALIVSMGQYILRVLVQKKRRNFSEAAAIQLTVPDLKNCGADQALCVLLQLGIKTSTPRKSAVKA